MTFLKLLGKEKLADIAQSAPKNFGGIIKYLREEEDVDFLKLTLLVTLDLIDLKNILPHLSQEEHLPFLKMGFRFNFSFIRTYADFSSIIECLLQKDYTRFLQLEGVEEQLARLIASDKNFASYHLASTLLKLPEEERLPHLEKRKDEWLNSINTHSDFISLLRCLPIYWEYTEYEDRYRDYVAFVNLVGKDKLVTLVKNARDLESIFPYLSIGEHLPFLQSSGDAWPDWIRTYSDFDNVIKYLEGADQKEDRITFLKLLGEDKLIMLVESDINDLSKILCFVPEEERLLFLDRLLKEDKLSRLNINNLSDILFLLPGEDRLPFLHSSRDIWSKLIVNDKNFIQIIRCLRPKEYVAFLELLGKDKLIMLVNNNYHSLVNILDSLELGRIKESLPLKSQVMFLELVGKDKLAELVESDVYLKRILSYLPEEERLLFLQKLIEENKLPWSDTYSLTGILDRLPEKDRLLFLQSIKDSHGNLQFIEDGDSTWSGFIHTHMNFVKILKCLPENRDRVAFLGLANTETLNLVVSNMSRLVEIIELLQKEDYAEFLGLLGRKQCKEILNECKSYFIDENLSFDVYLSVLQRLGNELSAFITDKNIRNTLEILLTTNWDKSAFQSFLHSKEIQDVVFRFNSKNLFPVIGLVFSRIKKNI